MNKKIKNLLKGIAGGVIVFIELLVALWVADGIGFRITHGHWCWASIKDILDPMTLLYMALMEMVLVVFVMITTAVKNYILKRRKA